MPKRAKRAAARESPPGGKQPRAAHVAELGPQNPLWSFALVDIGGPWCFSVMKGQKLTAVLEHLRTFESMTWTEIQQAGSHPISTDKLVNDARRRLQQINLDDYEEIFSLRLGGKPRIWGIRTGRVLQILWWDPNHEVCPSSKE